MTTITQNTRAISFTLKNVELHYVSLGTPFNPTFADGSGGPQWSLMAKGISQEVAMDLKEAGVAVHYDTETEVFSLNLKQYTQTVKGKANTVNVFDSEGNELPMETRETIGMGTKAHVAGYFYAYNNESGTGISTRLTDVMVNELVEKKEETKEERIKRLFG